MYWLKLWREGVFICLTGGVPLRKTRPLSCWITSCPLPSTHFLWLMETIKCMIKLPRYPFYRTIRKMKWENISPTWESSEFGRKPIKHHDSPPPCGNMGVSSSSHDWTSWEDELSCKAIHHPTLAFLLNDIQEIFPSKYTLFPSNVMAQHCSTQRPITLHPVLPVTISKKIYTKINKIRKQKNKIKRVSIKKRQRE